MALTKVEGGVIADNTVSALQLNVDGNGTDGYTLISDGDGSMTWQAGITNPTITSIDYPGTATAADDAGGESVIVNGTLFASGITCTVGGTAATTAFNSATQITITTPAKAAGSYAIAVTNTDGGTATQASFIQYSGIPIWTTAAGNIGSVQESEAASFQVTATEGTDTIEYAVTTGALPTGLSLATATGAITGTAPSVSADTTTTFSITATDDENQTSAVRSFNIIVTNDVPSNHFNTVLYTGDGGTQPISTVGFKPDFTWLKERDGGNWHNLQNSLEGATKHLYSNARNQQDTTTTGFTSFDNLGFTLGDANGFNTLNKEYVAWNWKAGGAASDISSSSTNAINVERSANATAGFSIVTYEVQNTGAVQIPHGLNSTPKLAIVKKLSGVSDWFVYNSFITGRKRGFLNNSNVFDNTGLPTLDSTNITFAANDPFGNPDRAVIYFFSDAAGFTKIGTYVGNRQSDVFVQTDFEPAFVMIKAVDASDDWFMVDNKREGVNAPTESLLANDAAVKSSFLGVEFLTNGFKLVGSVNSGGTNNDGTTFMYLAVAGDGSTTTPSLANSFSTITYTGNAGTQSTNSLQSQSGTVGFTPDFTWIKEKSGTEWHNLFNSVSGSNKSLYSNESSAQAISSNKLTSFDTSGFSLGSDGNVNKSSSTYVAWNWKAGGTPSINTDGSITSLVSVNQAAGFSVINYNGATNATADGDTNGGAYWSCGHGLGDPPELVIVKKTRISAGNWYVGGTVLGSTGANGNHLTLNTDAIQATETNILWGGPSGTFNSTTFGLGAWDVVNRADDSYLAYCWKSIAGYSKISTYTGNGNAVGTIETTNFKPGFLMIKSVDASGESWLIYDSVRNPTNPRSCQIRPNTQAGEQCGSDAIDFNSTNFQLKSNWAGFNALNKVYMYLAIKEN